ncbi:MAG: hypothetical protein R3B70_27540 [Polyangiaceae bacterium]
MRASILTVALAALLLASCDGAETETSPEPSSCVEAALPLQNARAFTLGETFYLPRPLEGAGCPENAAWAVKSAPAGSLNTVHAGEGAHPRFTPDVAGDYVLSVDGVEGSEIALRSVARTPAERFRNHYLTPLFGAEAGGGDVWTANGASYTVTHLAAKGGGSLEKVSEIPVGDWPAAIALPPSSPYVLVVQRGADSLGFIHKERGVLEDALWVGDEPVGVALSPDGGTAYVSLATQRQVAVVDLASRAVKGRIDVGFDPRALAVSPDGKWLFVASYRSGNKEKDTYGNYGANDDQDLWIVDTEKLSVAKTLTGISADLRAIALSADGKELFVAATNGDPIPTQTDPEALPFVHEAIVIDADPASASFGEVLRRRDLLRQDDSAGPLVNPAGVLVSGDTLWVAGESSEEVVALDRATLAEKFRAPVGRGARKIVPLGDDGTVAVHCYQSFDLHVISPEGAVLQVVSLTDDPRPADVATGEWVFSRPGGEIRNNHACLSCHIETQTDGQNWRFGPNIWHNVRPLNLLGATTPLEWGAYVSSPENFGYQGPASIMGRPAEPEEAEGLSAFLGSLLGAPAGTDTTLPDGSYSEAGLRGKDIFEGKGTCFSCHTAPLYTNRTLIKKGKSGVEADVPTLLGAYRHGVYFVAGGARDLDAAVDTATAYVGVDLTAGEKQDLVTFLGELTAKKVAPLGLWPDIDTNKAVYPDIEPWALFSEPVDDTDPERSAQELAAEYVVLLDSAKEPVAGQVLVEGTRLRFVPDAPLTPGEKYEFVVKSGLPFRSGGVFWGDWKAPFEVAKPAAGDLTGDLTMTINTANQDGPVTLVFTMQEMDPEPGGLTYVVIPETFATQQRQEAWARVSGEDFVMESFAFPIGPTAVGDARDVVGTVTEVDSATGNITKIEGTMTLGAPGFSFKGIPFVITPKQ